MGPNSDDIVRVWDVWKIPRDDVTRLATERRHRAALQLVPKHHAWRQLGPIAIEPNAWSMIDFNSIGAPSVYSKLVTN